MVSFMGHYIWTVFGNFWGILLLVTGLLDVYERYFDKKPAVSPGVRRGVLICIIVVAQVAYKDLSDGDVRKVNLKKRVEELAGQVFDSYTGIKKEEDKRVRSYPTLQMTPQQLIAQSESDREFFESEQEKEWRRHELSVAAVLEEISEEGEKESGLSVQALQDARSICVPPFFQAMGVRECGIRLKAIGEEMF